MKILVFMMEIGNGHKATADSIKHSIERLYPDVDVKVYDTANDLGLESVDIFQKRKWRVYLKHPKRFKILYSLLYHNHFLTQLIDRIICSKLDDPFLALLEKEKPDYVLSTHFTSSNVLGRLKAKGKTTIKDAVLITDAFSAHSVWTHGENHSYFVYDKKLIPEMLDRGIRRDQCEVVNFPLRDIFRDKKVSKSTIRKKLGFNEKEFITLYVAGGEGIGKIEQDIYKFLKANIDMTLIVICGKNKQLYERLNAKRVNTRTKLIPRGFVKNMDEYIWACDLAMGKSGISFSFEVLFCSKPFLITHTMANEERMMRYLVKKKVGWYKPDVKDQIYLIKDLIKNRTKLKRIQKFYKALDVQNGSDEIAELIMKKMRTS